MISNDLQWLLYWYDKQCDGDWEHCYGIRIITIDNPGWHFCVNLSETDLANRTFSRVEWDRSKNDWLYCYLENENFECFSGPFNLPEALKIFRNWVENN